MAQVNVFLLGGSKKGPLASALTDLFAESFNDFELIVSEEGGGDGLVIVIEIKNVEQALRRNPMMDLFGDLATAGKAKAHD